MEVTFVHESDFLKEGKGYFLIENSRWGKSSTISLDSNDSLADVSDFGEETVTEVGSDSGDIPSHDDSESTSDSERLREPSTSARGRSRKKATNLKQKGKPGTGGKQECLSRKR